MSELSLPPAAAATVDAEPGSPQVIITTQSVRGQGTYGTVRETSIPGVLVKSYVRQYTMDREAALWQHVAERCGTHPGLPYIGLSEEGLLMRDGGRMLYQASEQLCRQEGAVERFVCELRDLVVLVHRRAGIEHRDLNPLNVLVGSRNEGEPCRPVLIDLTNSSIPALERLTKPHHTLRNLRASPIVRSPEETLGIEAPPFAHDAWAIGVILVWLMTDELFTTGQGAARTDGDTETSSSSDPEHDDESEPEHDDESEPEYSGPAGGEWMSTEEDDNHWASGEEQEEEESSPSSSTTFGEGRDELSAMMSDVRRFARFYGAPTQIRARRAWWVALCGNVRPLDNCPGRPVIRAIRRREWHRVPRSAILCRRRAWRRLRTLASLLLSYDANVRVQALHDDRLWDALRYGLEEEAQRGVPEARQEGHLRSTRCHPGPFRSAHGPSISDTPLVGLPLAAAPTDAPVRPPYHLSRLLAVLADDMLSADASPEVFKMAAFLVDALKTEDRQPVDPDTPYANIVINYRNEVYGGAVAIIAASLIGCFGNAASVVLRPQVFSRFSVLPSVSQVMAWMWRSGVVARALRAALPAQNPRAVRRWTDR